MNHYSKSNLFHFLWPRSMPSTISNCLATSRMNKFAVRQWEINGNSNKKRWNDNRIRAEM